MELRHQKPKSKYVGVAKRGPTPTEPIPVVSPYKRRPRPKPKPRSVVAAAAADPVGVPAPVKGTKRIADIKRDQKDKIMHTPLDPNVNPWEKQSSETVEAYLKFCIYRDLMPIDRSYHKTADIANVAHKNITSTASIHHWVERAAAWDFHIDRARLGVTETYQIDMAERHAQMSKRMLEKTAERLEKVNLNLLGPKEIAQWMEVGIKLERLSRGMSSGDSAGGPNLTINNNIRAISDQEILMELSREGVNRRVQLKKALNAAPPEA